MCKPLSPPHCVRHVGGVFDGYQCVENGCDLIGGLTDGDHRVETIRERAELTEIETLVPASGDEDGTLEVRDCGKHGMRSCGLRVVVPLDSVEFSDELHSMCQPLVVCDRLSDPSERRSEGDGERCGHKGVRAIVLEGAPKVIDEHDSLVVDGQPAFGIRGR